jgi:hypothetical protein
MAEKANPQRRTIASATELKAEVVVIVLVLV